MYLNSDLLQLFPDTYAYDGEVLNPNSTLNPAGLIAAYHFTDNFTITDPNSLEIKIDNTNITYQIDREYFKILPKNQNETQWLDVEDENFIAWMYMETFPRFKKKLGKINSDLNAGNYTLTVGYNWNFPNFHTEKYFVIMSGIENTLNPFYGYVLIVTCLIYFIAIIVLILIRSKQKKFLNPEDLKW
jgi:hypothetical protein